MLFCMHNLACVDVLDIYQHAHTCISTTQIHTYTYNTHTYIYTHTHSLPLPTSAKRLRLNYDRSLFGMKFSDAESLSMCLENTATLVSLRWGPHPPSDTLAV